MRQALQCLSALLLGAVMLVLAGGPAQAQPAGSLAPLEFQDRTEEARFQRLTAELRCVMCQNQSLADSNAQVAQDMRREVLALMRRGMDDAQVRQFLVDRYGEFVLYRPAVDRHTWLLWFGPGLVLVAGGLIVLRIVRRRAADLSARDAAPSDGDQEW